MRYFNLAYARAIYGLDRLKTREEGQGMTEYVVIVALVAIAAVIAMTLLSGHLKNAVNQVGSYINGGTDAPGPPMSTNPS
jgi:Flp pilus assembly pilin Flp